MKMSRRAMRMERHHKRTKSKAALNMVSLMDIFTILVFFLLVSQSNVQDIPNAKEIKLPESVAEKLPKETVVIAVSKNEILVQGRKVADVKAIMGSKDREILGIKKELKRQSSRRIIKKTPDGKPVSLEVTIMGDKDIPYQLLKKIMYTCAKANYGRISLAVSRKVEGKG